MIDILFEDEFIIAVNKPSGVPSHSLRDPTQDSCETRLRAERPGQEVHLLHRLDTGTSGVLLFARSKPIYEEMRELFQSRKIEKVYQAWASPPTHAGTLALLKSQLPVTIDVPLAHSEKSKKKMIALPEGVHRKFRGKAIPALTIVHSITEDQFEGSPALRFDLEIVTGVMHQIRVHLKYLGFPLLGDRIYGDPATREKQTRLALHAARVSFKLNGQNYQIACPS